MVMAFCERHFGRGKEADSRGERECTNYDNVNYKHLLVKARKEKKKAIGEV